MSNKKHNELDGLMGGSSNPLDNPLLKQEKKAQESDAEFKERVVNAISNTYKRLGHREMCIAEDLGFEVISTISTLSSLTMNVVKLLNMHTLQQLEDEVNENPQCGVNIFIHELKPIKDWEDNWPDEIEVVCIENDAGFENCLTKGKYYTVKRSKYDYICKVILDNGEEGFSVLDRFALPHDSPFLEEHGSDMISFKSIKDKIEAENIEMGIPSANPLPLYHRDGNKGKSKDPVEITHSAILKFPKQEGQKEHDIIEIPPPEGEGWKSEKLEGFDWPSVYFSSDDHQNLPNKIFNHKSARLIYLEYFDRCIAENPQILQITKHTREVSICEPKIIGYVEKKGPRFDGDWPKRRPSEKYIKYGNKNES